MVMEWYLDYLMQLDYNQPNVVMQLLLHCISFPLNYIIDCITT